MLNICSFIQKFFCFIKTVSKKMYRTGFVVMSGAVLFAIVTMNSNSFNGAGKNRSTAFDGSAIRESISEEDDTDETAEIQPERNELQNIVSYLQEEDINTKESEPIASLVAAADREHVGISSNNALTSYSGTAGEQNTGGKNTVSKTLFNQSELNEVFQMVIDVQKDFLDTVKKQVNSDSSEIAADINDGEDTSAVSGTEVQKLQEVQAVAEVIPEPMTEAVTEPETQAEIVQQEPAPGQNYNPVNFEISDDDYYWLIRIVEAEAGDQDEIGRILVANVIFNRVRSGTFPNTVKSVIFQNNGRVYQFEPVKNERIYDVTPSQTTIDCVGRAMAGEDYSAGALYFTMRTSSGSWFNRELNLLFVHGDHYFYAY